MARARGHLPASKLPACSRRRRNVALSHIIPKMSRRSPLCQISRQCSNSLFLALPVLHLEPPKPTLKSRRALSTTVQRSLRAAPPADFLALLFRASTPFACSSEAGLTTDLR